jgi:hypothetical protein
MRGRRPPPRGEHFAANPSGVSPTRIPARGIFTKSVYGCGDSSRHLNDDRPNISVMDIVAIALGLLSFLLLLALIEGIDKI